LAQDGFIKLHRKLLEWEWYGDPNTLAVFVHLLLNATYRERNWRGITLQPGDVVIGREQVARETGVSVRSVRTAITRLKTANTVTTKTTRRGTVISIVKWRDYQCFDDANDQLNDQETAHEVTTKRPGNDQETTTREERKKERRKEGKKDIGVGDKPHTTRFTPPSFCEVQAYCQERQNNVDPQRFIDFYSAKGWRIGSNPMKDWKAAVRTWEAKDKERGYGNQRHHQGGGEQGPGQAQSPAGADGGGRKLNILTL
jgi:DNA-binding transcriptional regulator YhcF (GntR family)